MKNLRHFLSLMFFLLVPFTIMAQEDITDQFLQNADLSSFGEGWDYDFYTDWNTGADVPVVEFYHTWSANPGADIGYARDFHFTQTITLPAGDYRIAVSAFYREGNGNGTNTKAYIFAGDKQQYVYGLSVQEQADVSGRTGKYVGASDLLRAANAFSQGDFSNAFDFSLTTEQEITLGFRGYIDTYNSWCILGPVKLYKYSLENYLEDYRAKVTEANAITGKMGAAEAQALSDAIVPESSFNLSAEVTTAIATLTNAINDARKSIADYADLTVVLENAATIRSNVEGQADANILATYDNAIADILNAYNAGTVTDFAGSIAFVEEAVIPLVKSQKADNSDFTMAIINPHVNGSDGWTCEMPYGGNGPMLNNDKFEYWAGNAYYREDGSFDYYQIISGLPNGYYRVSASMFNSLNDEGGNYTEFAPTSGLYAASGDSEVITLVEEDSWELAPYTTDEILVTNGTLRIGVKNAVTPMAARWFVADDFHLTLVRCYSPDYHDGDEFTAQNDEGLEFRFKVLSAEEKTCQLIKATESSYLATGRLTIPSTANGLQVISIGEWALSDVAANEIIVSEGIKSIDNWAIPYCNNLTRISLPASLETIMYGGRLSTCKNLAEIEISSQNTHFTTRGANVIIDINSNCIICGCGKSQIPEGITSIGNSAFSSCTFESTPIFPTSLREIGEHAFDSCTGLKNLVLPEGLEKVGFYCFYGSDIESLYIPSTLNTIIDYAFSNNAELREIKVSEDNSTFDSRNNCNAIIKTSSNKLVQGCNTTIIPDDITSLGWNSFSGLNHLKELVIPEGVTDLGDYTFYSSPALETITIPSTVTKIHEVTFYDCYKLKSIYCYILEPFALSSDYNGPFGRNNDEEKDLTYQQATLYVPAGTKALYEATEGWNKFQNIVEMDIPIDATNFPDENFRAWLLSQSYGTDGLLSSEEIEEITSIDVSSKGIQDLKGIGYFARLTKLVCSDNPLTTLDLHYNHDLNSLWCDNCLLTSLNVADTSLEELHCTGNNITGRAMDALIASLPVAKNGQFFVMGNASSEGNECTPDQVTTAKEKGWTSYQWNDEEAVWGEMDYVKWIKIANGTYYYSFSSGNDDGSPEAISGYDLYVRDDNREMYKIANWLNNWTSGTPFVFKWNRSTNACEVIEQATAYEHPSYGTLYIIEGANYRSSYADQTSYYDPATKIFHFFPAYFVDAGSFGQVEEFFEIAGFNIDITTAFPDENFRNYLLSQPYGEDGVLTSEEISGITVLDVSNLGIRSLKGIEFFEQLKTLYCYSNQLSESAMDELITSLPIVESGKLYVVNVDDNNVCTPAQIRKANVKGWTAYQNVGDDTEQRWEEMEGEAVIAIDATNFPDENFRNYLLSLDYGQDGVLTQEEIEGITEINVGGKGIADLTGIELFTNLVSLYCSSNQLTYLDVSKNVALVSINCNYNQLTSLDVSKNVALIYLSCTNNQLTSLDVSKNTALQNLSCSENQLTSLDVTNNVELVYLGCTNNQLTSLDVSKNTALQALDCWSNQLMTLDVTNNVALRDLECDYNQLTSLDVTKNVALEILWCPGNQLTSLDVSKNTALQRLYCYSNQLTSLDVSKNVALIYLSCYNNQLTSLDVSKNVALQTLNCYFNQLTSLDVTNNVALQWLYCYYNQLTSLDLTNNDELKELYCYNNQIKDTAMDELISSLPTVDSGNLYAMYPPESGEGNEITPAQVAAANSRGWKVFQYDAEAGDWEEIVGEEIEYSWVKMATGTCYNNFFYDESEPFSGLELYVREDNPECFKIKDWLFGNDFEFIWNRTTNKCVVRKQLIGYEHPSYGPMSIIEGSNFGYYSEHSYYDPETRTFHFFPVYFVDAGSWGLYEDRFEITAFDTDVIMGDANGDGEVNVSDIVEIVNYILQKPSQRFVLAASDLNGDSEVNVTDIVKVVSIILSADASYVRSIYPIDIAEEEGEDQLNLIDSSHQTYALSLDNSHEFVAAQFDVHLDGKRCINDIVLNSARCNGHLTAYTEIAPDVYRVIVYSTDNSTFSGDNGEFINLMMNKPGNILIDNIIFVTSQMNEVRFAPLSSNATQIADIDGRQADTIYSVSGYKVEHQAQTLRKGIYIINGKKHIVK